MIVILVGPSGAGKTTLCKKLLEYDDNLVYSLSATTREKREGEIEGKDYYFLTKGEFKDWEKKGRFLEVAKVHDYYYGTPKDMTLKSLSDNKDVIMDIDVEGAEIIKKKMDDVVSIFILPPNLEEARRRIKVRGMYRRIELQNRMKTARKEIKEIKNFDYTVVNDDLEECAKVIKSIIIAEKHSIDRMEV